MLSMTGEQVDKTEIHLSIEGLVTQAVSICRKDATNIYLVVNQMIMESVSKEYDLPLVKATDEVSISGRLYDDTLISIGCMPEQEEHPVCSLAGSMHLPGDAKEEPIKSSPYSSLNKGKWKEMIAKGENPFRNDTFRNPKMIGYICKDCGKFTVRKMVLADSNKTHCHWCRVPITIEEVDHYTVKCSNCDESYYTFLANGLAETVCKSCHSPIDVVKLPDGKGVSANLLGVKDND